MSHEDFVAVGTLQPNTAVQMLKSRVTAAGGLQQLANDPHLDELYEQIVADMERYESQRETMEENLARLTEEKRQLVNERSELSMRCTELEDRVEELEIRLQSSDAAHADNVANLEVQLRQAQKRCDDQTAEINSLTSGNEQLTRSLNIKERQLTMKDDQFRQLAERLEVTASSLDNSTSELNKLRSAAESRELHHREVIESLEDSVRQLTAQLEDKSSAESGLNHSVHRLLAENGQLRKQIEQANDSMRHGQDLLTAIRIARSDSIEALDVDTGSCEPRSSIVDLSQYSVSTPTEGVSLDKELESLNSRDKLLQRLEESELANQRLRAYAGDLLVKILERDPTILEVNGSVS